MAFERVPMLLYRLQPHGTPADTSETFERLVAAKLWCWTTWGPSGTRRRTTTRRTLLMLYEARHDAGRRTVWTSNKTPREVGAFMADDRLSSRIAGRCRVVGLDGRDWRLVGRGARRAAERESAGAGRAAPGVERAR